jgi:hypothetical protein
VHSEGFSSSSRGGLKGEKEGFEQQNPPNDADEEELQKWNYAKDLEQQIKEIKSENREIAECGAESRSTPDHQAATVFCIRTIVVHNGVMALKDKSVRQSVTLPAKVATQVRSMAKRRRLSANRMLVELVEEGLKARKQKEKAFFELAERFRAAEDPKDVERLGEQLGQMVFGR